MLKNDLELKFVKMLRKWQQVEAKRTIYGLKLPQTKAAITELCFILEDIFSVIKEFSIIKKGKIFEIILKDEADQKTPIELNNLCGTRLLS